MNFHYISHAHKCIKILAILFLKFHIFFPYKNDSKTFFLPKFELYHTAKRQNLMQQCLFGLAEGVLELNNTKIIANMSISTILGTLSL